jgi:hypothetical protein
METKNTYPIVIRDNEANILIAEIETDGDIDRLCKENEKLNNEYRKKDYEGDDYYTELSKRTGIKIYFADVLDL